MLTLTVPFYPEDSTGHVLRQAERVDHYWSHCKRVLRLRDTRTDTLPLRPFCGNYVVRLADNAEYVVTVVNAVGDVGAIVRTK